MTGFYQSSGFLSSATYDQDKERELIDDEGWTKEAFDGTILAYKLLVKTIWWTRVCFALSDWSDGIINPAPG